MNLHPKLLKKIFVTDLALCRVLLEDNAHYPWLLLVPRRDHVSRIIDLNQQDRLLLYEEMELAQEIIWKQFKPFQLNVATLGNKVSQLHIHIVGRNEGDPAWPDPVWGHAQKTPYTEIEKESISSLLKSCFS